MKVENREQIQIFRYKQEVLYPELLSEAALRLQGVDAFLRTGDLVAFVQHVRHFRVGLVPFAGSRVDDVPARGVRLDDGGDLPEVIGVGEGRPAELDYFDFHDRILLKMIMIQL